MRATGGATEVVECVLAGLRSSVSSVRLCQYDFWEDRYLKASRKVSSSEEEDSREGVIGDLLAVVAKFDIKASSLEQRVLVLTESREGRLRCS